MESLIGFMLAIQVTATIQSTASFEEPIRPERDTGLPVPFEKLENNNEVSSSYIPRSTCLPNKNAKSDLPRDCIGPGENALLHVTNRRKPPLKKKSTHVVHNTLQFFFLMSC